MVRRIFLVGFFCVAAIGLCVVQPRGPLQAADKPKPKEHPKVNLNDLNLEVQALQQLHDLKATTPQLHALEKLAGDTAAGSTEREAAKASEKYGKLLDDLHDALVKDDGDRVAELDEKIEGLKDEEKPEFDDAVETTDEAQRQAPDVLRLLSVDQVVAYVSLHPEDVVDPVERINAGLEESRTAQGEDWEASRDAIAEEVAQLAGGFESDKAKEIREKVVALLDKAHRLKDDDYTKQTAALEKEGRSLVEGVGPTDVLRHNMERELAELLSNPQLAAGLKARLQHAKP